MSKEKFIEFVREHPKLVNYVKRSNSSWQNLYEIYVLYGEDSNVWNQYLNSKDSSINELVSLIKGINLESVRKVVDGLQKTVSLIQEIGGKNDLKEEYQRSPIYEDLDD